ncbi:CooT family nickel-binding protein [Oscillospiraceae bacterium CM]|nr:CooT family nickel-binding protein [Oscillospiraceae bacterium CM]
MCLSKVYGKNDTAVLLNNIQKVVLDGDDIVFTDLLENETRLHGKLLSADLVSGRIIIDTGNA